MNVPGLIETQPDFYKPLEHCSSAEIRTYMMLLTGQAQTLIDEAKALGRYIEDGPL